MKYEFTIDENHFLPISLENETVRLELMQTHHEDGLYEAGKYADIWTYTTAPYCLSRENTKHWISTCLQQIQKQQQWPYVIIDKSQGKIVGSSSYLNIILEHKAIEIGFTFLTPTAQKTAINRNCKFILLSYAFEHLKANRVALQTHERNTKSRHAIEGLGAVFEGVLRDCRIQHNGDIRSSAFYSIIKPEWNDIKNKLIEKINSRRV